MSVDFKAPGAVIGARRRAAGGATTDTATLGRRAAWLESRALFIAAVSLVVVLSLAGIQAHLSQDGWLALVAGRIIAAHGIPQHDYLTVMAYGHAWIDQQWLSQLISYELERVGGLALFAVTYVALTGVALALAITAARRLGGQDRHIVAMLPLGAFFYFTTAVSIRTQGFAYPLFVATLWLLASQTRNPTRRVYLTFPLLIVWANLHGSVTLGVAMAFVYGAVELVRAVRTRGLRAGLADTRAMAFVVGAPLCLLATPYGPSMLTYYRSTLLNPAFSKLVTEWQPVTAYTILAVPFLALVTATIYALGRSGSRTPAFDQVVLVLLALAGIFAVRNITWFGLATVVLLPAVIRTLVREKPPAPRRVRVNLALAVSCIALAGIGAVVTFARPAAWFESTYPTRALAVIEATVARHPATRIFADIRFADWLVWHDPRLAGRIAYDTSFENLTAAQLASLATLAQAIVPGVHDPVAPYSLLVLDPANKFVNRVLIHRPGARVILRSKRVIVATKPLT